jgi:hypothetical protein
MMNHIRWGVAACATALILFPIDSGAQTPATSFDELSAVLQAGEDMYVTGIDGRRTRGTLLTVTPTALELTVKQPRFLVWHREVQQRFANTDVATVQRKDSGREGATIGFAAVFIPVAFVGCINEDPYLGCEGAVLGGFFIGLFGAAIGGVIDGMFNATVYRTAPQPPGPVTVSLLPLLTRKATGALLNVRF